MALRIPCNPFSCKPRSPLPSTSRYHSIVRAQLRTETERVDPAPVSSPTSPTHLVTVHDRKTGVVHQFRVPEDQYILHTAEAQEISLPFACRHELKSKGYALLCVSFPTSDIEVETQDEDEVYWLQFGRYFARGPIERDDYALELAMADE